VGKPKEHIATGPNQVWSWDISYLPSSLRGQYFYLYLFLDVWSRKIVGWSVREKESMDDSSELIASLALKENVDVDQLVLHSDNGSPMKGATMLATLQSLGIVASLSRPRVSNDNPYSESLFRTMKYRPEYPKRPFARIEDATAWVAAFVDWYNNEHLHSSIQYVTPNQRHNGEDKDILKKRKAVYEAASKQHPERWANGTRSWEPIEVVALNPDNKKKEKRREAA
jgi:transposase InsO family protein